MRRRSVLAGLAGAAGLASGCTAVLPEATPPSPGGRRNPPNLLCESTWGAREVTVRITAGNRIDAGNTGRLWVFGSESSIEWVGGENATRRFPLAPGDSITLSLARGEDRVRVAWQGPSGEGSASLCTLARPEPDEGGQASHVRPPGRNAAAGGGGW